MSFNNRVMSEDKEFIKIVHSAAKKKILFLPHAVTQMSMANRMISTSDVRKAIFFGKIIEDYPNDTRGHSCLILGIVDKNRPIHVVCSPKEDFLAVITAYIPDTKQWDTDFKRRI